MKILAIFSLLFFGGVLLNLLPYDWQIQMSANIEFIGFFVAFGGFILSLSFLTPMLFEEKLAVMKKYIYVAVGAFSLCLTVGVMLKQEVYELFGSTLAQYILLGMTSAVVFFCLARVHLFAKEQGVHLSRVNWHFLKIGASFENTPLFKAITRLDRYFIGFAVVSVLIESSLIFIGITFLILVLATKDVKIVFHTFKAHLPNRKKAFWTVVLFYISYVMAVVVAITLEKDVLTIFAASLSMLLIKIYYHEIVKETLRSAG